MEGGALALSPCNKIVTMMNEEREVEKEGEDAVRKTAKKKAGTAKTAMTNGICRQQETTTAHRRVQPWIST